MAILDTPKWIIDLLQNDNFACPHCKNKFKAEYVKACGVRLSFRDSSKQVLYVEYHCGYCKQQPTLLELYDLGFDEFAFMVLEDTDNKEMEALQEKSNHIRKSHGAKRAQKKKKHPMQRKNKSRISQKDVESARRFLNECQSHEDFLDVLGVSAKNIKKKKKLEANREEHENKDK